MKKLLYSILALAGVVATSCTQEHIEVVYNPENVTPAELVDVKAGDIASGVATEVTYTNVNYNMSVSAPVYTLYVAKSGTDMAEKQKLSADFSKPTDNEDGTFTLEIDAKTINNLLTKKLKAEFDQEISVDFQIETAVSNEKGTAVAGSEIYSNIVTVSYTPVAIKEALPDADEFDKVWVIGDYCGWDHGKTQFLFDYTASGNVYSGVVDFADAKGVSKAANGFKLTGVAKWDNTCNWGLEDNTTAETEASSLQLITDGGSQDIKCYSKRYYKFSFDKTSLILTKEFGFDSVGVVGVNGDWNNDIAMEFNPKYCRFYADVTFVEGDKFKCRADGAWDLNWGATNFGLVGDNDGNVIAEAGNYRVYLNLNKGTLELNADMYGKQEPGVTNGGTTPEPEPEPEPGIEENRWGVVGTINSWGGTPDLYMNEVGENLYARMGVTVTDADLFKVRFNNGWDINYGGPGEDETYAVTVGEEMALVANGKNLSAPAGTYDIYFNIVDFKMWVMPQGETPDGVEVKTVKLYADVKAAGWDVCKIYGWGDLGEFAGTWSGTEMVAEGDYFVYEFDASAIGKTINVVLNNGAGGDPNQTVDITNVVLNDDVVITLTENGNGTTKWNYTINGEAPVTPEPEPEPTETTYGLIGQFNGWGEPDVDLVARGDGWYVVKDVVIPAAEENKFLIRLNDKWSNKFGFAEDNTFVTIDGKNVLTAEGADMWIVEGTYDFYFNPTSAELYVMTAGTAPEITPAPEPTGDVWTIKGDVNNTQWNNGEVTTTLVDGFYVAKNVTFQDSWNEGANFKVLKNGTWMGSTAGGTHNVGDAIAVSESGNNITMNVTLDTPYDIYIDGANNNVYVVEAGATPAI